MLKSFSLLGFGASAAIAAIVGYPAIQAKPGVPTTNSVTSANQDEDQDEDKEEQDEDEAKPVKMKDLSKEAQSAIKKAAGSNEITGIKSEEAFGVTVYEAIWKDGESDHEVVVSADGTVLEHEEVVAMKDAPRAVQAMASKKFPKASKIVVEKKTMIFYSVEATIGGKDQEVLLAATGQEVEVGAADNEDEENEADEGDDDDHKGKASSDDDDDDDAKGKGKDDDDDDDDGDDDGGSSRN